VETCGNCGEQKRTKNGRFPQAVQRGKSPDALCAVLPSGSNGKTRAPEPAAALLECRPAPERWGSRRNCLCKKRQKPTKNPCSLPKTAVENLWKKKKSRKFRKKVCRRA
jgi:hypothetical protein